MKRQWIAFSIGLVCGLSYVYSRQNNLNTAKSFMRLQDIGLSNRHHQFEQWLQTLRHHTPFSFAQQLMRLPDKTAHRSHEQYANRNNTQPSAAIAGQSDSHSVSNVDTSNLVQALQQALKGDVPAVVQNWKSTVALPSSTGSLWAIQVATHANHTLAKTVQQQLVAKGHDARIVQGYNPLTDEVEYHVRLHGFATQKQAQIYRKTFQKKEPGFSPFCVQQSSSER